LQNQLKEETLKLKKNPNSWAAHAPKKPMRLHPPSGDLTHIYGRAYTKLNACFH